MLKCKVTGLVLDEKLYTGSATPPDAFADRSRWGNNGTHTAITWVRNPQGLWVRGFNGTTSYVNCGSVSSLKPTNAITLEAWIYIGLPLIALRGGIICLQDAGTGYALRQRASNTTLFANINASPTGYVACGSDKWAHTVSTYDGINLTVFVNGVLGATVAVAGLITYGAASLWIGRSTLENTHYFRGYISSCRIYSYALNAAQIRARFESTRHWYGV